MRKGFYVGFSLDSWWYEKNINQLGSGGAHIIPAYTKGRQEKRNIYSGQIAMAHLSLFSFFCMERVVGIIIIIVIR